MNTQSECLKTGAIVYLEQYDEYIVTDLMQLGSVYHFWIASEDHIIQRTRLDPDVHLIVHTCAMPRRAKREMLALVSECSAFSYEAKPLEELNQ